MSGNIHPDSIEIDNSANHQDNNGASTKNAGTIDWIKDSDPNGDTASVVDGVAIGLITNVTAAAGGTGHWNGVRIVDGIASGEQDIFLKGGKVNDPGSWEIGPGTVGSAKFDGTQMYLANNQTNIYFGMERRGNDGTTAFDFEFNQLAPISTYIPNRSDGDVLISFELRGSGGSSGSVNTYIFVFNGTTEVYEAFCDDDPATATGTCVGNLLSSINSIEPTAAEPWGYVNRNGNWALTPGFERRMFAEAQVPLSFLPGVNVCGGSGFVQIRTRSSASLTSDAKDTTKIFEYVFGGPTAAAALTGGCGLNIHYDAAGSTNAAGGTTGLTYEWRFEKLVNGQWVDAFPGDGPDATAASGDIAAPSAGTYRANLKVLENTDCVDDVNTASVTVFDTVGGTVTLAADCDDTFTYLITPSGGSGSYVYDVAVYKNDGDTDKSGEGDSGDKLAKSLPASTATSGSFDIDDFNAGANGPGEYYAIVTIKDANDTDCLFNATSNIINVRRAVGGTASLTADCDDTFTFTAQGTGGSGTWSYAWKFYKENGANDILAGESNLQSGEIDADNLLGDGQYYAVVRITDTNHTECFSDVTTNAINVRHPLTVELAKGNPVVNTNNQDGSFSVTITGTVGNDGGDTIVKAWEQSANGTTWTSVGTNSVTLSRTMSDIISGGTAVAEPNLVDILGDPYRLVVTSLQVRLTVSRSGLGEAQACPVTSAPLTVKSAKAVDP